MNKSSVSSDKSISSDFSNADTGDGSRKICICVDADGGDNTSVVPTGVKMALESDPNLSILLVGRHESVANETIASAAQQFANRIKIVETTEVIEMADHPALAVRQKKDSSIVVGCKAVHDGLADGFYSAGSTGACLTAATVLIGRVKGVKRPALATIVPVPNRPTVFTDCGANADCKPEYILQFAHMGKAYSEVFLGIQNPTVGLLNNGSEDTKGSEFAKEAHELLQTKFDGFYGNVEGGDITSGTTNVVVTDGFSGNIALKAMEGTAALILGSLKQVMLSSVGNKLAAAKLKPSLKRAMTAFDSNAYGGAPLLGIRSACVIGHGSSSSDGIKNGIAQTAKLARAHLPEHIENALLS